MSRYAENNLRNGEQIVMKAKINPLAAIKSIIGFLVFVALGIVCMVMIKLPEDAPPIGFYAGLVCMLIGVLILLIKIIYLVSMCLVVTNKRVLGKVGVIKKHSLDYPIDKVESIQMKSSFWGAIFRYNSLKEAGSGGTTEIVFGGISNSNAFKNTVTDAVEQHQAEARRAQAEEIAMAMRGGKL